VVAQDDIGWRDFRKICEEVGAKLNELW